MQRTRNIAVPIPPGENTVVIDLPTDLKPEERVVFTIPAEDVKPGTYNIKLRGTPDSPPTLEQVFAALTPRQKEIVQLVAQGRTNYSIAKRLGLSEHTAKFHVNALLVRTGATGRAHLAALAGVAGVLRRDELERAAGRQP